MAQLVLPQADGKAQALRVNGSRPGRIHLACATSFRPLGKTNLAMLDSAGQLYKGWKVWTVGDDSMDASGPRKRPPVWPIKS